MAKKNPSVRSGPDPTECSDFALPVQTISSRGGESELVPSRRAHLAEAARPDPDQTEGASGRRGGAGSFVDVFETTILFAVLLNQTPRNEVLELFVSTEAEHFFSATDGVTGFEIFVNDLEEIVETEGLFV